MVLPASSIVPAVASISFVLLMLPAILKIPVTVSVAVPAVAMLIFFTDAVPVITG